MTSMTLMKLLIATRDATWRTRTGGVVPSMSRQRERVSCALLRQHMRMTRVYVKNVKRSKLKNNARKKKSDRKSLLLSKRRKMHSGRLGNSARLKRRPAKRKPRHKLKQRRLPTLPTRKA